MTLEILFVGLQQKGTSLALALAQAGADATHIGFDYEREAGRAAKDSGAVDKLVLNPYKAASSADVVIVTLPTGQADEYIHDAAENFKDGMLLLDASPLKASSLRWARDNMSGSHYIGLVPIVQYRALFDLHASYRHARADLFQDSLLGLVIPPEVPEQAINIAVNITNYVGAEPFFIDAAEMEAITSLTDTLPAALSLTLLQTAANSRGWPDIQRLAGRSFVAATHNLAEAKPEAMAAKFMENRQSLLVHLDQIILQLQELRQAIDQEEEEAIRKAMSTAIEERQSLLVKRERANWEAEEKGLGPTPRAGLFGSLFGGDPDKD